MKKIPLHSLIVSVGESTAEKRRLIGEYFAPHEVVSAAGIANELVGGYRTDIAEHVFNEMHHRASLKLSLGERVIIDAANLRRDDRVTLAHVGIMAGVPVFYLACDDGSDVYAANARDIARGDGIAEVIDSRSRFEVINRLPDEDALDAIKLRGYAGITVVGDVHGMYEALQNALAWARFRRHFLVFLGDIIDYGRKSLEVSDEVYRLVMRGEAEFLMGNHERKIMRWLDQQDAGKVTLTLSEGNRVTTQAISALAHQERRRWANRFRALVAASRHHRRLANILLVHGAAHDDLWHMTDRRLPKALESLALFGEVDRSAPMRSDGYPNRTHGWVNHIPNGHTIIVGHEIRSMVKPLTQSNKIGGSAVFLDTGSGKGGQLTTADLVFAEDGLLRLMNFTAH
jgi:protein phosphatase